MRRSRCPLLPPASRTCNPAALLAVLLVVAVTAAAAPETIPITGIVRDAESREPIANAIVSLTGLHRSVSTGEDGRYTLDGLPGPQRVTVHRLGYAPQEFEALVPAAGALEINIVLHCEPIELPPIEVRSRVPVRGLEPGSRVTFPDRSVSLDALYQHPLLTEPDFLRAMGGGEVVIEPESPSGLHIRGGAADQVAYLVDGIPVFSPYHSAGTFSAWNPDAMSAVDLVASSAMPDAPDALSGIVSASTRTPGAQHHTSGSVSATQARATVDGPVGRTGAGYLVSVGSAFPGLIAHKSEPSHLSGETLDWLGKVESPVFHGRLRLSGYGSRNEIDTAALSPPSDTSVVDPARNVFGWHSRSVGAEWTGPIGSASLVLRSWAAFGDADASWGAPDSADTVASTRRDTGLLARVALPLVGGNSVVGVRVQTVETAYDARSSGGDALSLDVATPVSTAFVEHEHALAARGTIAVSVASALAADHVYWSPAARARWRVSPSVTLSGTAARRHQFGQSLRNSESVASNVFPADLYVAAGAGGVPVAHSNIGIVGVEHRPTPWVRLGVQAYLRDFAGLALVAPDNADPFATAGFVSGSGDAYGVSLDAGASRSRFGILASYGFQHVALTYPDGRYVPDYGAVHSFEAGVVYVPAPTFSIRLGFESVLGRRTTSPLGTLEYEAANLLDQGAEFAGSPAGWAEALGGTALPAYYRLDLGVRKQWRARIGRSDGLVAVFGTVSNLMGRTNVLTETEDPSTGRRTPVEMRPLSPVVVGIDWRF